MIASSHIHIIGGGLAGSLLSLHLADLGHTVEVFEKRRDLRSASAPGGRSINLAISARGLAALERIGMAGDILSITIPMRGRMIHDLDGSTHLQPYSSNPDQFIRSVSRADLNRKLLEASAQYPGIELHFKVNAESVDLHSRTPSYSRSLENGGTESFSASQKPDVIFGADGAGSVLRRAMVEQANLSVDTSFLEHGYRELTIHPNLDGSPKLPIEALHIWPRGGFMLIALPNMDHSFTCTLFMPHRGSVSFEALDRPDAVDSFFQNQFPDVWTLLEGLSEQFSANPTGHLGTVRCPFWNYGGEACLLGDAAHAVVPFFGQGMNCAFEDCTVLRQLLDDLPESWHAALSDFSANRVADAYAIADMAISNYIEMRDLVNDGEYKLRRLLGFELEKRFPDRFIPGYSLVSFHTIPYSEAKARAEEQERLLRDLTAGKKEISEIDWLLAEKLVDQSMPANPR